MWYGLGVDGLKRLTLLLVNTIFKLFLKHFVKYIMSPLLLQRNETTKVTKIHIIEKSLENNEIMDMKDKPMVSESFTKKRQYLTIFDHPMHQFGPMMAMSCKGKN